MKGSKGKGLFEGIKTVFFELKAEQVKLSYISDLVKQKWGDEFVIVTSDGTEFEDSAVTQS